MIEVSQLVLDSTSDFWTRFVDYLPTVLLALVLLFAGFIFAWLFEKVSSRIMKFIMLDKVVEKIGLKNLFDKAGLKVSFTRLLSGVVYWFVLLVFLGSVVNVLGLTQLSEFLDSLVAYLPNVIGAIAILIIGILAANLLFSVVKNACESANITSSKFLASLTKWSIFVFAIIASLVQLKIAPDLLTVLFTGIVIMISLAGGLAFGLGGKDAAKEIIEKIRGNVSTD